MIFLAIILTAASILGLGIWIGRAISYANPTDENLPQAIVRRGHISLFEEEGVARCGGAPGAARKVERSLHRSE